MQILKNNKINNWEDYYYKINSVLIPNIHLKDGLNNFYKDIIIKYDKNSTFVIQFKIMILNEDKKKIFRSISFLQTIKVLDFNELLDIFSEFWDVKGLEYNYDYPKIDSIIFTYKKLSSELNFKNNKSTFYRVNKDQLAQKKYKINGFNLPTTMDFTTWGETKIADDYKSAIVLKYKSKAKYYITINEYSLYVELCLNNKILFNFTDTMLERNSLTFFSRNLKTHNYIYKDNKLIIKEIERKCKYLKTSKKDLNLVKKILTMDLETITINNVMTPVCISIFDGFQSSSFYLSDFDNSDEMLIAAIESILVPKFNNHFVYLHNFSFFDSVFLIKILSSFNAKIYPVIRDNRIIDFKFIYSKSNKNLITLNFRDSYLLIPSSLSKLSKAFNVLNKSIFPYKFLKLNNINYIGNIPLFEEFDKISLEDYIDYSKKYKPHTDIPWNFKKELIKYCEIDVISLYQVINEFRDLIYSLFRVDVIRFPTISSLAFGIFRSNFLREDTKIPLVFNQIYYDIKESYTGGSVDLFKPFGVNIKGYDVNSLYPYIMKNYEMPVGNIVYFMGDISLLGEIPYGIFEVEVEAPEHIRHPILQVKVKTKKSGYRTISPLGNWTSWYHSEEIKNAKRLGYKFKILRGYKFESEIIFKDYVEHIYELKSKATPGDSIYIISKLLLNSLYGRFGMSPDSDNHAIINNSEDQFLIDNKIKNVLNLKNGKSLITYQTKEDFHNTNLNISIPIASSITALSRVYMSQFKNNPLYDVLYGDTDSIFIDKELDSKFIGNKLGQLKLEHDYTKVIFLSPKVYGGIDRLKNIENNPQLSDIKVKGLKDSNLLDFNSLQNLLIKNSELSIFNEKWHRNFSEGNIDIKKEFYTLMVTGNKRIPIYENDLFINTKPYTLNKGIIVDDEI